MERWPNFFIVGAPKAGTTSLYFYLREIPEIYMSPIKEPHYFAPTAPTDLQIISDKKKYLNLFQGVKNQVAIGEASVYYLLDPKSPFLIHEVVPHARIIMILRDPVERAFSHYLLYTRIIENIVPFHEMIRMNLDSDNKYATSSRAILECGFYSEQVKRYLEVFGRDQVKILVFEEFILDPKKKVEEVLKFLGVNHDVKDFKGEVHNPYGTYRLSPARYIFGNRIIKKITHSLISEPSRISLTEKIFTKKVAKEKMLEEDRIFLQNLYHEDVKKLVTVLNRPLPWPNF